MAGLKMGQDMAKDIHENITEGDGPETVDNMNQEKKESNPAFLKYLQFKVITIHLLMQRLGHSFRSNKYNFGIQICMF